MLPYISIVESAKAADATILTIYDLSARRPMKMPEMVNTMM